VDWSPGVAGFDGSPRRAAQAVTAALADFLQVEQVQFCRVVHQFLHLHTLTPSQRDGNGVRCTSVDTGSFQSAQIDSLERLFSRNGMFLKKWLLSRVPAQNRTTTRLEERVVPRSVLEVGGCCATAFYASLWGGVSPDSRTVGGGVEVAVAGVVVVIVVGSRIFAVDVAVAVVVAVVVAVFDMGPVSCATQAVSVASFSPALISAVITPLAV